MDQAILWAVIWLVAGLLGTGMGLFGLVALGGLSLMTAVETEKPPSCVPVAIAVSFTFAWTILWLYNLIIQVFDIVRIATA